MTAIRSAMWALALVVSWLAASPARANNRGVSSDMVLINGDAAARDLATVTVAIEAAVRSAGWSLPQQPLARAESERMLKCLDGDALGTCVKAPPPLARIFVVTVKKAQESGSPMLVLIGKVFAIDQESPAETRSVTRQRHCESCSDDTLAKESTELVTATLQELSSRIGKTFVEFKSTPPGANILVDGVWIGATDGTFRAHPGKHVARFTKDGYIAQDHEFTVEERRTAKVAVTLQPSEGKTPPATSSKRNLISYGLMGVGAAALVGGIAYSLSVDAPEQPGEQPEKLYSGPAIAVAAAGGAVLIGGIYLRWFHRSKQSKPRSVPTAVLHGNGGVIGWSTSF